MRSVTTLNDLSTFSSSNGETRSKERMQSSLHLHLPIKLPLKIRLREFIRHSFLFQGWEHVVVNNKIDSITMPKWLAVALLTAVLGFFIQSYWARSTDHDTLVEIRTELRLAKEASRDKEDKLDGTLRDLNSWKDVMNGNLKEIKGMLSQQQLNAIEQSKRQ